MSIARMFAGAAVAMMTLSGAALAQDKDAMKKSDEMMNKEEMAKDAMMKKDEMAKDSMTTDAAMKEEMNKEEMMAKEAAMKKDEMMKDKMKK